MEIKENISLAFYTFYKIGGPARFFVEAKNSAEVGEALQWASENGISFFTPHLLSAANNLRKAQPTKGAGFILGVGSNILVSDKGFDGLVIRMVSGKLEVGGCKLVVDSGVMMARAVLKSAQVGLTGFEWGIGVPGTIGGSIRGNAGCFGGEMKDVVESVRISQLPIRHSEPFERHSERSEESQGKLREESIDPSVASLPQDDRSMEILELNNSECEFSYRDSIFKRRPDWIIISATLKLEKGDPKDIQEKIKKITVERSGKQDIGTKSCGCIFKNIPWERKGINREKLLERFPELAQFKDQPNIPASFLIDQAGLKGRRVGKVFISPKHANFFVNDGGATAEEVIMLIAIAKDTVRRKYGILLEEEIQYVGF